ncbi:hypothetical protein [Kitasatospora sp. SC0581]|uniref:hypothetical protein n=1 Tax=Kitasatospora sp. SC0581 TaxID=3394360 RepID=UPI003A88F04E
MTPAPTPPAEAGQPVEPAEPGPVWAPLTRATAVDRATGLAWLSGLGHNRAAPADLLLRLLDTGEHHFLDRDDLPDGVLDAAIAHPDRRVRMGAAESGRLSPAQWERLIAATPGAALRELFAELAGSALKPPPDEAAPPLTPAELTELAALAADVPDIDPAAHAGELPWVVARHADAEAMRLLAASPKTLVRRSVARAPRLPADVAELLARDEDRAVRILLAESCEDAPARMLLDMAGWWDGSLSFPGRPRNHPHFPRQGLLRLAADPNPRLRALALDDPAATPAHVERAAADPDPAVRRAAAADPRLAPATAAALAADPDSGVRHFARVNPALPPEELVVLLLDPCRADAAARNPAIPAAVLHRMADLAIPHAAVPRR